MKLLNKINQHEENDAYTGFAREFTMQILSERIVITANGFFNINLDLFASVRCILIF